MKPGDFLAAKYRLEHVLGSGGMGTVWAAVNERTGRPIAIKLMHSPTPELRARMLREARAGGTLKHKNIVDIYDVGETESGDPFLVMERLSGETLDERLRRLGSLPPATAVDMAMSIAAALRAAHAKGIIHRDLKPANVFLHREPEGEVVKVLDFGVSKHLQDVGSTITAGLVGSPAYMSPEQARAEPKIDARADLWSLGVVLFEMLAGRRPFPASSPYAVIAEVVGGPIPSLAEAVPGLSRPLVHIVERCLTRDVDARVGSADELIRLLGACLDLEPGENDPTTKLEQRPRSAVPAIAKDLGDSVPASLGRASGRRRPSAVVALVVGASALSLILVLGVALRRPYTAAEVATSAAASTSTQTPEAGNDGGAPPRAHPSGERPVLPP